MGWLGRWQVATSFLVYFIYLSTKLRLLQFFTCLSWGISPAQILLIVQATAIRHSIFYFSSFSMFIKSRISKSVVICSFFSALYPFHLTLFYSSFYSLFCFLPLDFLISLLVFFSNLLSFFSFPITLCCLLLPHALLLFNMFSFY